MGKRSKDNGASAAAMEAQRAQTALAQQLVRESTPVRRQLFGQAQDFLGSDIGDNSALFSSPQYQAAQAALDAQSQRAQESAIANMPEGGQLVDTLTNIDMQKALGLAQAGGSIADANVNRALQLATFGAAQGTQGFASAGNIANQQAQMQAQQNAAKSQGLGGLVGTAVGLGVAGGKGSG